MNFVTEGKKYIEYLDKQINEKQKRNIEDKKELEAIKKFKSETGLTGLELKKAFYDWWDNKDKSIDEKPNKSKKSSFNKDEYKKKFYEYLNDNRRPMNMNNELNDIGIYNPENINETNYKEFDKFYKKYKDVVEKNVKKYNDLINNKNNPPEFIKALKFGTNNGKDFSFLDSFLNTKILYMGKGKKYTLDDDDKERIDELKEDLDKYKKEMKTFKEKKTYKGKKIPALKWVQTENTIEAFIENTQKKINDIKYNENRKENKDNIERAYKNKYITKAEYDKLIGNVSYNTQDDLATIMSKKGYFVIYQDNPNEKPNKPKTSRDKQIDKKGYSNVLKARSDMLYDDDKPVIKTDLKLRKGLKDKEKKAIKKDVIEKLNKVIKGGRFINKEAYENYKGDVRGIGINLDSDDEDIYGGKLPMGKIGKSFGNVVKKTGIKGAVNKAAAKTGISKGYDKLQNAATGTVSKSNEATVDKSTKAYSNSRFNVVGSKSFQNIGNKTGDATWHYALPATMTAGKHLYDGVAATASTMLTGNPMAGRVASKALWNTFIDEDTDLRKNQKSAVLGRVADEVGKHGTTALTGSMKGSGRKRGRPKGKGGKPSKVKPSDNYDYDASRDKESEELRRKVDKIPRKRKSELINLLNSMSEEEAINYSDNLTGDEYVYWYILLNE